MKLFSQLKIESGKLKAGEMADADYGYVGAARGKVSLYRKKECIEKNIPEEQAVDKLLQLIETCENERLTCND